MFWMICLIVNLFLLWGFSVFFHLLLFLWIVFIFHFSRKIGLFSWIIFSNYHSNTFLMNPFVYYHFRQLPSFNVVFFILSVNFAEYKNSKKTEKKTQFWVMNNTKHLLKKLKFWIKNTIFTFDDFQVRVMNNT